MSLVPDAMLLNVSPALQQFDRPLLNKLSQQIAIAHWEYSQTPDEPLSLEIALGLLHDYLKHHDRPVHLIGHGTSGLLGLLYARRYPKKVRSLTLLSVGVHPAVDWQAHYYAQLEHFSCSREMILTRMVCNLFGHQSRPLIREILRILERDLSSSLSPHTLYQKVSFFPGGVPVPLLVCGGQDDTIINSNLLQGWQPWLKQGDRVWQCSKGRYFFHYFHSQEVTEQITDFWRLQPLFSKSLKSNENIKVSF
jgi:pimeloyl-ACP methyl ester carboxylesterase